jgi:hypothetical protein
MSNSDRPTVVLLGTAASLITVLTFVGWKFPGSEPEDTGETVTPAPATTAAATFRATTPAADEVTCTVTDELGEGQTAEAVRLTIGGKTYRMSIGADQPRQRLTLRYTGPAELDYLVQVSTRFEDGSVHSGEGSGSLTCSAGESYALTGDYTTTPTQIFLELS